MTDITLTVDGMSCQHCVKAVTDALRALPGVSNIAVDLPTGKVTLSHDAAQSPQDALRQAIQEQGFDVVA